jgi:WD40 repeat protein
MALGSLQGHGGPIYGGGWDRDGRHVITTSFDGAIRRWDATRATTVAAQKAHTDAIADLAISSDDRWALTAGADRRAVLWDRRSLQPVVVLPHAGKVRSVMFAPDNATALTVDDAGDAQLWRLPAGTQLARLGPRITAATYARDGQLITAGDGKVRFWTATGAELGAVALDYTADRLVLDPTGRWLFVRGETSSVLAIDIPARAATVHLGIRDHQVLGLAADDSRVAITDGATVRLWQLGSWIPQGALIGHRGVVTDVWFLHGGRMLSAAADGTLVWGRDTQLVAKLADSDHVFAFATSPDGNLFATTGTDGAIRIWDAVTARILLVLPGHQLAAWALQITHDGATAISGGNDGRLVAWDVSRRTRSPSELADIVRCRVPLRLEGDVALPRDLDFDDPTCRSLALDR